MNSKTSPLWYIGSLGVVLLIVFAWQYLADTKILPRAFFPGPDVTWKALQKGFASGAMIDECIVTLRRMAFGWVLASIIGIVLGTLIGMSRSLQTYIAPMLEALRPLPASALAPLAALIFGLSDAMIIALVAFGALWPMLMTTVHGFANVHPRKLEVSQALGLSQFEYARKIALPSAMPDILGGLRLGLTIALILTVVGEMITVQSGLGSRIIIAARRFNAADIFAGIVLLGAIGFLTNAALALIERHALRWQAKF